MDVPDLGFAVVVVSDGDQEAAQAAADELADLAWEARQHLNLISPHWRRLSGSVWRQPTGLTVVRRYRRCAHGRFRGGQCGGLA